MWSDVLQTQRYRVLALGCVLEGETNLVLAGFAAYQGLLDPVVVVSIATAAGFAGARRQQEAKDSLPSIAVVRQGRSEQALLAVQRRLIAARIGSS
jgi:hypothetical protein